MLCCLGGGSNPGAAYAAQTSDGFGTYPANRTRPQQKYVHTGGNALAAAPPNMGNPDTVYVTVPPGVFPGQTINVAAPDGSGRMVTAVVPNGTPPGSQFMVQLPPAQQQYNIPMATAEPYHNNGYSPTAPSGQSDGFAHALDQPVAQATPMAPANYSAQQPGAPPGQKLLLVRVPPGTAPGTTINVQVPEEPGRLIAAQVPPNVTEFHVAYQPRIGQQQQQQQTPMIPANTYNNYAPNNNNARPNGFNNGYNNNNQRFNNNNGYNNNQGGGGGGGMGGFLMPALGGAALGAAAVGLYDHFSNNDDGGYDGGGGGDYDGGGDDYGGGDDFGGDW